MSDIFEGPGFAGPIRAAKTKFITDLFAAVNAGPRKDYFEDLPAEHTCSDWIINGPHIASALTCSACKKKYIAECHAHNTSGNLFAKDISAGLPADNDIDMLENMGIEDPDSPKVNMDVFTAQKMAAERAKIIYDILRSTGFDASLQSFRECIDQISRDEFEGDPDRAEDLKIRWVIVGASVSGLTFHATLENLMLEDGLHPRFQDLFTLSFVDIYMKPMERLRQARDRTIVPRFEYERILETNLSSRGAAMFQPPETGSNYLVLDETSFDGPADDKWKISHTDMPPELRWAAGPAREVAAKIETGYLKCLERFYAAAHRKLERTPFSELNGNLGCLYQGISSVTPTGAAVSPEEPKHLFQMHLTKYHGAGSAKVTADPSGDILLSATGLGIDVPGEHVSEMQVRVSPHCECLVEQINGKEERTPREVFDFPSEQRSYWDPAKPELDLSEARASEIFVYGISDSAAGAVFSTLLREFDHCTFKTLAKMVWERGPDDEMTAAQHWFRRVSAEVEAWRKENTKRQKLTITEQWHYALRSEGVKRALYKPDRALNDCLRDNYLRTMRKVFVAIKRSRGVDKKIEALNAKRDFDKDWQPGDQMAAELLMSRAWPENRILAACLFPQLELYLVDVGGESPGQLKISRDESRLRKTYRINGEGIHLAPVSNFLEPAPFNGREFKYVLNCGGPAYFQRRGNRFVPKAPQQPWWQRLRSAVRRSA